MIVKSELFHFPKQSFNNKSIVRDVSLTLVNQIQINKFVYTTFYCDQEEGRCNADNSQRCFFIDRNEAEIRWIETGGENWGIQNREFPWR